MIAISCKPNDHNCYFTLSLFPTGYKRYPSFMSPLTERIRKRKAFADTELDSSSGLLSVGLPQAPPLSMISSTATGSNALAFSSMAFHQALYAMPLPAYSIKDSPSDGIDFSNYSQSKSDNNPTESSTPTSKIRIVNNARLFSANCSPQSKTPPATAESTTDYMFNSVKPKLSFSIESIIGTK